VRLAPETVTRREPMPRLPTSRPSAPGADTGAAWPAISEFRITRAVPGETRFRWPRRCLEEDRIPVTTEYFLG
jgi:hypothetical protein